MSSHLADVLPLQASVELMHVGVRMRVYVQKTQFNQYVALICIIIISSLLQMKLNRVPNGRQRGRVHWWIQSRPLRRCLLLTLFQLCVNKGLIEQNASNAVERAQF